MLPTNAKLIYTNHLSSQKDIQGFRLEGHADVSFPNNRMRLKNVLDPSAGQKSNFVFWCPEIFPTDLAISWEFRPIEEPGLCMFFFSAMGRQGEDLFDPNLSERTGEYHHYHSGDINAFHLAYFRRRYPSERAFHLCNLRKSHGGNLVCQGADPIPNVEDIEKPYKLLIVKKHGEIKFYINELLVIHWQDEVEKYGPFLQQGRVGFRQMAPLIAEYSNLNVYSL